MKKLILFTVAIMLTNFAFSQTEKGNWNLGISSNMGNLFAEGPSGSAPAFGGFNLYNGFKYNGDTEEGSITTFNLQPGIGYFLADGFLARINLGMAYAKFSEGEDDSYSTNILSVGPELRYYIGSKKMRPYIGAHAAFGSLTTKFSSEFFGDEESKANLSRFGGYLGLAYFLSENASIDLGLGFSTNSMKEKEEDDKISFNNLGINFGVNFFF
jgi:opacity protein-like surface antigen